MQTNYAINLFNWRLQVVRKQAVYFGGLLLATLLLTASVVSILFGYQQQLKNNFVQQNQQQTALRHRTDGILLPTDSQVPTCVPLTILQL